MGWYGPQGDCGCCEKGPCDPTGLVTDNFNSVNPRWTFSVSPGPESYAAIDTLKPGLFLRHTFENSAPTHARRCIATPTSFVGMFARYKSTVMIDINLGSPPPSGLRANFVCGLSLGTTGAGGINLAGGIIGRYNPVDTDSGDWDSYALQRPGESDLVIETPPEEGDVIEIYTELLSHISGSSYSGFIEWKLNSSVIHDGVFTVSILSEGPVVRSYQSLSASDPAFDPTWDVSMYIQDWETETGMA